MAEVQVKQEPEWNNEDDRPIVELARVDAKQEQFQVEVELKREPIESSEVPGGESEDWEKMPGTPKVSPRQWAYLLAFMEAHQEFARGTSKNVTPVAKRSAIELWEKLAKGINNVGSGTRKSAHQWREYWKNKRYEVRKKYSSQQKEASEMGRQALPTSMYMSAKDERILAILGNEAILGEPNYQSNSKAGPEDPIAVTHPNQESPVPQIPPPVIIQASNLSPLSTQPLLSQTTTPTRSSPSPTPIACERGRSICLSPTRRIPVKRPYQRAPQPLEWARLMDERRLKMSMRKVRALEHLANSYAAVATAIQTLTQTSKTTATTMQGILQEMISMRETIQQGVRARFGGFNFPPPNRGPVGKSVSEPWDKANSVTIEIEPKEVQTQETPNQKSPSSSKNHCKPNKNEPNILQHSCQVCSKKFRTRGLLNKHKRVHSDEKPFSCSDCGKTFKMNNELNKHKRIHAERSFCCDLCEKRFIRKEELFMHKQIHTGTKPFSCDECDKQFAVKQYLLRHKQTHKGGSYPCEQCGKIFTAKKYLNNHKQTHTGLKPYVCDVCNKQFALKMHLNNHRVTHTGEKPFSCGICEKNFSQLSSLIKHRRVHTGEKPFSCDICEFQFTSKWLMDRHKDTHAQKLYSCDICEEVFTQRRNLAMHQKTHRGNV